MNINIQIERLVLEGVPISPSQGRVLQRTVEVELGRLLRDEGLPENWQGSAVSRVPGGTMQLTPGTNPSQLGQQIARVVYQGMKL
ncbi:hypothetical protein [uncultured Nostoc sp.]|uniref:hypothetical protein n=1 Tax=uncultured Nostoc sp. TaxID=340711 RepID=UPI0035C9F9E7